MLIAKIKLGKRYLSPFAGEGIVVAKCLDSDLVIIMLPISPGKALSWRLSAAVGYNKETKIDYSSGGYRYKYHATYNPGNPKYQSRYAYIECARDIEEI